MDKFGKSQPVRRLEDRRFLTGEGHYVDDIAPDGALHAVFARSQVAHGVLAPLDLTEVREMPGVVLALAAEDLGVEYSLGTMVVQNRDGSKGAKPRRPVLASGKVRFVGEAVAMIVAVTSGRVRSSRKSVVKKSA